MQIVDRLKCLDDKANCGYRPTGQITDRPRGLADMANVIG